MDPDDVDAGDRNEEFVIPPLTRNPDFRRLERTDAHIRRAMALSRDGLIRAIKARHQGETDFICEEALVFVIRHHARLGDQRLLERLFKALHSRCIAIVINNVRGYPRDLHEDIVQDVLMQLDRALLSDGDQGDFAQVRFWKFLDVLRLNACQGTARYLRPVGMLGEEALQDVAAPGLSPEDITKLSCYLARLPAHESQAFIMRYKWGLSIGGDDKRADPEELTIASHFGVSGRTIRNWLKRAVKTLRNCYEV